MFGSAFALRSQRPADAISGFMTAAGVPPETVEGMVSDPSILAMAATMRYDIEVMGELRQGGTLPEATRGATPAPLRQIRACLCHNPCHLLPEFSPPVNTFSSCRIVDAEGYA